MNVCVVCEFWVSGKAYNIWVHCHRSVVFLRFKLLLYYAWSVVNRVYVVLSGFSVRLFM